MKKEIKKIKKMIEEFTTYDRIYYDGLLTNLLVVILIFLSLLCLILGFIIF